MPPLKPRFSITMTDLERRLRLLHGAIGRIQNLLRLMNSDTPTAISLRQTHFGLLEDNYAFHGSTIYGYGYPIELIRTAFANAGLAGLRVFERRGTQAPFPVMDVAFDPRYPKGDPRRVVETPRHPPGTKDHTVTNSRANVEAVCHALIGGEFRMAARIASLAWDPPDADWLATNSEICTPNDQRLAYAIKHFFADEFDEMRAELKRLRPRPKADIHLAYIAGILEAIVTRNEIQFREWIGDLLDWHERQRAIDNMSVDPYLCIPAIAFSILGIKRGVVVLSDLPKNNVYLPTDLILLAQTGEIGEEHFVFDSFEALRSELPAGEARGEKG